MVLNAVKPNICRTWHRWASQAQRQPTGSETEGCQPLSSIASAGGLAGGLGLAVGGLARRVVMMVWYRSFGDFLPSSCRSR
ncbi:hypothetical protein D9M71_583390 [compost metagenome]